MVAESQQKPSYFLIKRNGILESQQPKQDEEASHSTKSHPLSNRSALMLQQSLVSLRESKAISNKEKKQKRMAILSVHIELKGYDPLAIANEEPFLEIVKKCSKGKMSPETAANEISKLIESEKVYYART